ncbi:MAG: hypothetical protein QXV32_06445 [Conexivisphaerales archaeon]
MQASRATYVARLSAFVALTVGSDYLLSWIYNVKLVDFMVFVAAFLYGFRFGAAVGILSELIWSSFNPLGFGGAIIPFLISGEVIYAFAGSRAAKIWKGDDFFNPVFGAVLALCTFAWDVWTNFGTALIGFGTSLNVKELMATELIGVPFMVPHELSNFVFGMISPAVIKGVARLDRMNGMKLNVENVAR